MQIEVKLDGADRQAVLLALAELWMARPGWRAYLKEVADKFELPAPNNTVFDYFVSLHGIPMALAMQGYISEADAKTSQ